ncbi:MAG: hypothetical protein CVV33_09210 [Methanomicrobiales archaeon HGW-Methanomicrobiales-4]|nr:MAG: hypothetical protein CVV33_09210 [Methanomicrobiales archaeon HGW-Methanomicrobiales-4]
MTNTPPAPKGLEPGKKVDVRVLEAIALQGEVLVILYFEEDLSRTSTYTEDLLSYGADPEHERPFIELLSFLKFQREMSPYFNDALTTVPLIITIISSSEQHDGRSLIKGVLPFLDEMDLS